MRGHRSDFNEFNFKKGTMGHECEKILTVEKYEANRDMFKVDSECTIHNFVGINFNIKCIQIIRELVEIISFESNYLGSQLKKEIKNILDINI